MQMSTPDQDELVEVVIGLSSDLECGQKISEALEYIKRTLATVQKSNCEDPSVHWTEVCYTVQVLTFDFGLLYI